MAAVERWALRIYLRWSWEKKGLRNGGEIRVRGPRGLRNGGEIRVRVRISIEFWGREGRRDNARISSFWLSSSN